PAAADSSESGLGGVVGDSWTDFYPAGRVFRRAFPASRLPSRQVTIISEDGARTEREGLRGRDVSVWKPKSKGHSTRLLVLSLNVHGLPQPLVSDGGRFAAMGRLLAERKSKGTAPHVVVLQEGFTENVRHLIREAGYRNVIR